MADRRLGSQTDDKLRDKIDELKARINELENGQPQETALTVGPDIMTVEMLAQQECMVRDIIDRFFELNKHYGPAFPGAKNNSLYKLGAEWLAASFHIAPEYDVISRTIIPDRGNPEVSYEVRCDLYVTRGGERSLVGSALGACTSEEDRYKYRIADRVCPSCGQATIRKGSPKYGGGWYCNRKAGGCGAKYDTGAAEITNQETGRVLNDDLLGLQHTILAMAQKRAFVLAIRTATGVSAYFDDVVPDEDTPQYAKQGDVIEQFGGKTINGTGGAFTLSLIDNLVDYAYTVLDELGQEFDRPTVSGMCRKSLGLDTWQDSYNGSLDEAKQQIADTFREKLVAKRESITDLPDSDDLPLWVPAEGETEQLIKEAAQFWGTSNSRATCQRLSNALGLTKIAKTRIELESLICQQYHGDYGTATQAYTLYEEN